MNSEISLADGEQSRKDRFLEKFFSVLARALYREIDVYSPVPLDGRQPQLNVANHFGGVSDALILLGVLPRRPGIVARDVIWNVPLVGRLMTWVGAIPVHKPEDQTSPTSNDDMFASCYHALGDHGSILIFPEGVTRNEPSMARVKTGAARIAIGARAHGVDGITIVPLGIHYEDKAALRSRVLVNVGQPLELDELLGGDASDNSITPADHIAVANVTHQIDVALRRVAPDFEDWNEARLLAAGADIALRTQLGHGATVPFVLRDRLANTLSDLPVEQRSRICATVTEYRHDLDALGTTDALMHSRMRTGVFLRTLVLQVLAGVLLFPFVVVGAAINAIPFLVVKAVGLLHVAPSMHSTIKPVVATLAFGATWAVVIWQAMAMRGWLMGLVVFVLLPLYLAAVVLFIERFTLIWRAARRWRAPAENTGVETQIGVHRRAVVEAVLQS